VVKAYTHEDLHWIVLVLRNADNYRKKAYFKVSLPNLTTVHPKINVSDGGGGGDVHRLILMVAATHRPFERPP